MPLHADVAQTKTNFNVKSSISRNRLQGLWQLLVGYRRRYIGAIAMMGISAVANTASLLLLRYVVDTLLNPDVAVANFFTLLVLTSLAFIGLATMRGAFAFLSGAWSAEVSEGIALRLRDYARDAGTSHLRGRRCRGNRWRDAREDQQRSREKTAAYAEDSGKNARQPAKHHDPHAIDGKVRNGQIDIHAAALEHGAPTLKFNGDLCLKSGG